MTLSDILKRAERFAVNNSTALLTAVGVAGTLSTAYLTGKASFKAAEIIRNEQFQRNLHDQSGPMETKEKVQLVWKYYIPPVVTGSLTVASIIGAEHIGSRRAAAVAAAYSLTETAFTEYKAKVVEKIGETKEQQVRDSLAQDRVDRDPVGSREVIIAGGEVLCYDTFTGRYFQSDMETIKKAQNDVNYMILNDMYASLSDFYQRIGLPRTSISDDVGWNTDKMLELEFSTVMSEDQRPCLAISFRADPIKGYYRLN